MLLIGLVAVLAAFQYRWLGQISEAEREQLRRSFTQRAREFADAFDLEIGRAYATLQLSQAEVAARDWTSFATAVDTWQSTATFPQMVRGIYLAEPMGEDVGLRQYDHAAREFARQPTDWPNDLEPVRRQLVASAEPVRPTLGDVDTLQVAPVRDSAARLVTIALGSVNSEVPALIVPLTPGPMERVRASSTAGSSDGVVAAQTGAAPERSTFVWLERRGSHVIVVLDAAHMREAVLPTLAATHFPEPGDDTYRFEIRSIDGSRVYSGGLAEHATISPDDADVTVSLLTLRPDLVRGLVVERSRTTPVAGLPLTEPQSEPGAPALPVEGRMSVVIMTEAQGGRAQPARGSTSRIRVARPAWSLVLQHGAGSLDAAVSQARRRNLTLSFGILAILSLGMALVVINARRSEQLAARQMEFVATVSHELRTPLTVIRSAAQNLSAGVVADAAHTRRYGELIDGEGRRLSDMVEQVLDYAGLTGNRALRLTQLTDAGALVNDAVTSCRPVVEQAGCATEVSVEDGLFVMADQDALRRAVQNLVTNAAKHAADGRWVGVTAQAGPDEASPEVIITVTDRGRGIPAAELPHVFDAFYRGRYAVDQQVRGNGLGLNLVKRIIEAHGGRVTVQSEPMSGAVFTIRLPAASGAAAAGGEWRA